MSNFKNIRSLLLISKFKDKDRNDFIKFKYIRSLFKYFFNLIFLIAFSCINRINKLETQLIVSAFASTEKLNNENFENNSSFSSLKKSNTSISELNKISKSNNSRIFIRESKISF